MQESIKDSLRKPKKADTAETPTSIGSARRSTRQSAAKSKKSNKQDHHKNGVWTEDEHHTLIEGMAAILNLLIGIKKYGRKWPMIQTILPQRTLMQLRTHGQKLFRKVQRMMTKRTGVVPFIRSKPTAWFFTSASGCAFSHLPRGDQKMSSIGQRSASRKRGHQRVQAGTKRASPSKSKHPAVPEPKTRSRKKTGSNQWTSAKQSTPPESKAAKRQADKPPTSDGIIEIIPRNGNSSSISPPQPRKHRRVNCDLKNTPEAAADIQPGVISESGPSPLLAVPPPPVCILPPGDIHNSLKKLLSDLGTFSYRLDADYSERRQQLDADAVISPYWRALHDCSVSLEHMVNDIMIMHQHAEHTAAHCVYPGLVPMRYPYRLGEGPAGGAGENGQRAGESSLELDKYPQN